MFIYSCLSIPPFKNLLLFLALVASIDLTAADYYFSTEFGDDTRSFEEAQNPDTPWRSLRKLNIIFDQLEPGDEILFHRGETYPGSLEFSRSEEIQIRFTSYGDGDQPIISGFTQIQDWTDLGNGIYESNTIDAGATVNMVRINGLNYAKGRYPNIEDENGGYLTIENAIGNFLVSEQLSSEQDWFDAQVVIRSRHWVLERARITQHSGNTINYEGPAIYEPKEGFGFFIQDHINTLDRFGEWYFNVNTQKVAVYFGDQVPDESTVVEVATEDVLVLVRSSNLSFEELTFEGANQFAFTNYSHSIENLSIKNCIIKYVGIDALLLDNVDDLEFENNRIQHTNNVALNLLDCPNARVRNNDIAYTGMQAGMGEDGDGSYSALICEANGLLAEYNRITNTGYVGIRFGDDENLIKNNYIDTFCAILDDGAAIYAYASSGDISSRRIIGNIVLNGVGANAGTTATIGTGAVGIYLDDNARDVEVADNTVAGCSGIGLLIHNVQNFKLSGNTLFNNNLQLSFQSDYFGLPISEGELFENICFSKEWYQNVFELRSNENDIAAMGVFDNNYYLRPLNDQLPLAVHYPNGTGIDLKQSLNLESWTSAFGHDQNSKNSPLKFPAYTIERILSDNRLPHNTFDDGIKWMSCFSAYSDCEMDWVSSSVLDGGALKVSGPSPSHISMSFGQVENDKNYIVRFSAYASQATSIEVYFVQALRPWGVISKKVAVQLTEDRTEYEVLISRPLSQDQGTLQFEFGNENTTYWFDNMELVEAEVILRSPDNDIHFEYNASTDDQTVDLDDNYVDAKNVAYSGSVELAPFESIILMKNRDSDGDGILDNADICPGFDDNQDTDLDGVPDGCDTCPGGNDALDADGDGFPDGCDLCPDSDDSEDEDSDGIPDGCDICPGFADNSDTDDDGVPNGCDTCADFDDSLDGDGDGVPNGCDTCGGFDDNSDSDDDGVPDGCDICADSDDNSDSDGDGVPDGCDICADADDNSDTDDDGVPNGCDTCADFDDSLDGDGDGVPDGCDICADSNDNIDSDDDGVPDGCDICAGSDDNLDSDDDGTPNGCDTCAASNDNLDSDGDGVPDGCDTCLESDDRLDNDGDGVPDGCDRCADSDDGSDSDGDGIPDGCDVCPSHDNAIDIDQDGIPDGCDDCVGLNEPICETGDCPMNRNPSLRKCYEESDRNTDVSTVPRGSRIKSEEEDHNHLRYSRDSKAKLKTWRVYPNPIYTYQTTLNIEYFTEQKAVSLAIMDHLGRTIKVLESDAEIGWNKLSWDITHLAAGAYYIYHANAPVISRKAYPFVVLKR